MPYPVLTTFDAPNGEFACVRRANSNTPLQALATLNEPLFLEAARSLALKTLQEGVQSDARRLNYAFRRCLSRLPDAEESAALFVLLGKELARLRAPDAKPFELAINDPNHSPRLLQGITATQLAAWTSVARVLLNLDEAISKE